jgi:hypothetical protein
MTTQTTAADDRRARKLAAAFKPDGQQEALLAAKAADPAAFAALPVATRVGSAYYAAAKAAFERMTEDER